MSLGNVVPVWVSRRMRNEKTSFDVAAFGILLVVTAWRDLS